MKALIYNSTNNWNQKLSLQLISGGLEPIETDNLESAIRYISHIWDLKCLITDDLQEDLLTARRRWQLHIPLLYITKARNENLTIKNIQDVTAVIPFHDSLLVMGNSIMRAVQEYSSGTGDQRRHYRVSPPAPTPEASLLLKTSGMKLFGNIKDISAGGVSVTFNSENDLEYLDTHSRYDFLTIKFPDQNQKIKILAHLKNHEGNNAGFQFDFVEPQDMEVITTYIRSIMRKNQAENLSA